MIPPALIATGLALTAGGLSAQQPPRNPVTTEIVGTWEGPYQSEMVPPGALKLTVARSANTWQVTLEIHADQPPAAGTVRDFKVEGNTISWAQDVADMNCVSTATLAAGLLKGSADCWQNGAVVVTASFLLEKKKP